MEQQLTNAAEGMRKNGFEVVELETAAQAKEYLLAHIQSGESVGVGGSVSVQETDVLPALRDKGCAVYSHWGAPAEERPAIYAHAHAADVYLCSANAVTKDGRLVLIDGNGNRVSAVTFGPKRVYFIISHSKCVDGGINTAVARIKQTACPQNARRLNRQTPCALTGFCKSPDCGDDCMCRLTAVVDRVPKGREMTVLFVEETLGY